MIKKTFFLALSIFFICSLAHADKTHSFTAEQVKQINVNSDFSFMAKDASITMLILSELQKGDTGLGVEILGRKLDIVVCEGWNIKDRLSSSSKKRLFEILREIKNYKENNPSSLNASLDQETLKQIFPGTFGKDLSYSKRAIAILKSL